MMIASNLQAAKKIEDHLLAELARYGYNQAATFAIKLALEEALNNAIRHGNGFDPAKTVTVEYKIDEKQFSISIADQGCGFNPGGVPDPTADENLEKPCGRGIMLMRAYMDIVRFNEKGNELFMMKRNC